ncbi:MAG TPA: DMT family transporter [Peptococcaceae bacterium]|jgi:drug/metabolite transporter (DMT)-like permease|nr:DMT family transporter [Clostridia bacterium]HOB82609.1 DMT family transporter [Peptococcaceae bacterium]HPZ71084.1 DMT family transporter [Peptococcaceae bacterium]HQD54676.1 DMT family transporter [Peptococcaceae bacterium]
MKVVLAIRKVIIILGVLFASCSAVLVRASTAPSMVLVFYRVLIASLMLSPFVLWKHDGEWKNIPRKMYVLSVLSGLFLGLHFSAYFESLRHTSIASSVLFADMEVFFVAFAMLVFFKEKISLKGWVGIGVTFLGSVLIAIVDAGSTSNSLFGDALALSAAAFMSVYTMIGKVCRKYMTTTVYTFLVYLSAAVTVLLLLLLTGAPLVGYDPINYLIALGLAVFCTLLGHSIYSWGLKYEKASFISTAKMLDPVFASSLGIIIFREFPPPLVLIGASLVIFGISFYSKHG